MSDKLRVIAGPFHPDLEDALAQHIARSRSADPFAPLAVVVPSSLLLARIRELLVVEHEQCLLNVHFLTFHQLALRLYEERILSDADPSCRLELAGDLFFEHLLSRIALRTVPDMAGLDPKNWTPGAWTALWATLRDLKDSGVDPAVALQGLAEGLFEEEDRSKLRAVFLLYAAVLETAQSLQIGSVNDLAASVTPWVARSSFLRRLSHVCYYGFYDLTQVQLSLLEAIIATCPTTLYFPLREHAGFTFARRFFDHYLSPLAPSSTQLLRTSNMSAAADPEPRLKIMNTVGPEDELTLVSKEILELVETYGYRFNEIGVVGRTLEGRHDVLLRVFDRHCIPFLSSAAAPIMQQPAAKVLLSLATLRSTGFSRERVLDVVASPFYRSHAEPDSVHARPDLWRVLAGSLGVTRGAEEWERLARAGAVETWIVEGDEDDRRPRRKMADTQVRVLWGRVSRLIKDCQALPEAGSASELTDAFLELLARHAAIPGLRGDGGDEPEPLTGLSAVGAAIRAVLEQLKQLDRIESVLDWEEWLMLLTNALTRTSISLTANDRDGVRVLDAMAARGLPFRALFLLDLNEQVFPRAIREDGFLRDRHRRVLSETLGYKIDEKLVGYDEEELLFTLLCGAARERLYLVYQRADVDGRPLAPSPYLDRFESGLSNEPDSSLPRRFTDRAALPLFSPPLSTLPELGLRLVLEGYDPSAILAAQGHDVDLFRHGWRALRNIEAGFDHADAHGGMTGPLEAHWRDLMRRGFSPTSLQQYAKCPFQYFASRVLGLDPVRITALEQLPPQEVGELCHTILRRCGERLIAMGWPRDSVAPDAVRQIVVSLAEEIFGAYTLGHGTGYFVLWQATKETIVRLILASLEEDQRDYRASGFRPVAFEVEAEGVLDAGPSQGEPIKIGGRLDRIDLRDHPPAWRIVDYKYRQDVEKKKDRDLLMAALRGVALQPPLYARMVPADAPRELSERLAAPLEDVQLKFLAPRWEPVVDRASFPAAYWRGSEAEQLRRTLDHFVDGVRSGRFFIMPGGQCDFCEYSAACRRFDASVAVRTYRSPAAKALRRIQKQKAVRE